MQDGFEVTASELVSLEDHGTFGELGSPAKLASVVGLPGDRGSERKSKIFCRILLRLSLVTLLLKNGVESGLRDRFVDFGLGAAGGNAADGVAIDLNGQAALVGEEIRERQRFDTSLLHVVSAVFGWSAVRRGVASFPLSKLDRVDRRAVCLFEEKKVSAVVYDTKGDFDVAVFGFGLGGGNHRLDGGEIQILLGWEIRGRNCCDDTQQEEK
jgi:hypothetical protein